MTFNKDALKGIDLQAAAVEQYGAGSTVKTKGDHAWDWQVVKPDGSIAGIDMNRAAIKQYNANAKPVLIGGFSKNDWTFIDFTAIKNKIIPIILVTADKVWDINAVKQASDCFESKIIGVQEWLRQQIDETFDCVAPLVMYTNLTSSQLNTWEQQRVATGSFNYYYGIRDEIKRLMGVRYNELDHIYLTSVLGGVVGWSSNVNPVAVVHSDVFDDKYQVYSQMTHAVSGDAGDDSYVIAHELLHAFGLDHTPESVPNRNNYVMWIGRLPNGQLTQDDKNKLLLNKFIK